MWKVVLAVCNDSFYTPANIVYSGPSVALACILFAAMRFQAPLPFDDADSSCPGGGCTTNTGLCGNTGSSATDSPIQSSFDFEGVFQKLYLPL